MIPPFFFWGWGHQCDCDGPGWELPGWKQVLGILGIGVALLAVEFVICWVAFLR